MRLFTPTQSRRLNEVMGFLFLAAGILVLLSFASFHPTDPSWNTVSETRAAQNLIGPAGAWFADFFLQAFGLAAFVFPVLMFGLGWKWIRSEVLAAPAVKIFGSATLVVSCCGVAALLPDWRIFDRTIMPGGAVGFLVSGVLRNSLNLAGSAVVLATALIISVYLVSAFSLALLENWFSPVARLFDGIRDRWRRFLERRREAAIEKREEKRLAYEARVAAPPVVPVAPPVAADPAATRRTQPIPPPQETLPWEEPVPVAESVEEVPEEEVGESEIPICRLDETPVPDSNVLEFPFTKPKTKVGQNKLPTLYRLPSTELLNEIPQRSMFDEQELKNTAAA